MSIIILLILLGLMYVVLIVPRQRELRRHNQLMEQLEVGQEVMSSAGIYGTIAWIEGDFVGIEVAPGMVLKFAKRAVAARVDQTVSTGSTPADGDGEGTTRESADESSDERDSQADGPIEG